VQVILPQHGPAKMPQSAAARQASEEAQILRPDRAGGERDRAEQVDAEVEADPASPAASLSVGVVLPNEVTVHRL
jgi:hypothetical protein